MVKERRPRHRLLGWGAEKSVANYVPSTPLFAEGP